MAKPCIRLFILISTGLILIVCAYSQEEMRVVSNDPLTTPRRSPAVFRHDEHNELAGIDSCSACHHVYDDNGKLIEDESSEDQRCSDCHELALSGSKPALMKAFHINCKSCHKARKKGPLMCGQCHVRGLVAEE